MRLKNTSRGLLPATPCAGQKKVSEPWGPEHGREDGRGEAEEHKSDEAGLDSMAPTKTCRANGRYSITRARVCD